MKNKLKCLVVIILSAQRFLGAEVLQRSPNRRLLSSPTRLE